VGVVSARKTLSLQERLTMPEAFLMRTDLRELGWPRGAVDAIFRACPDVYVLPEYRRPAIRVADYLALLERSKHDETRVR
jgi:hypothetical protein